MIKNNIEYTKKICTGCGKHFFIKKNIKRSKCTRCLSSLSCYRTKIRKIKILELMGGKCSLCGYNNNLTALEFHHVNSKEKEFVYTKLRKLKWETVVKELKKCILVCANCHREIHYPENNIKEINKLTNTHEVTNLKPTGKCPICNTDTYHTKYCSPMCLQIGNRKVKRPSYKELLNDVMNMPKTDIAKKYQVADTTVRKWIAYLNVPDIFRKQKKRA
jgi:hypothetical protein